MHSETQSYVSNQRFRFTFVQYCILIMKKLSNFWILAVGHVTQGDWRSGKPGNVMEIWFKVWPVTLNNVHALYIFSQRYQLIVTNSYLTSFCSLWLMQGSCRLHVTSIFNQTCFNLLLHCFVGKRCNWGLLQSSKYMYFILEENNVEASTVYWIVLGILEMIAF
jgi:hypothetical protein